MNVPPIITAELVDESKPLSEFERVRCEWRKRLTQLDPEVVVDRVASLMAQSTVDLRELHTAALNVKGDLAFRNQCKMFYNEQNKDADAFYKFILMGR